MGKLRLIGLLTVCILSSNFNYGQTVYSDHIDPQAGVEYDTTTTSGCSNCQILSPNYAADSSKGNASRIMVQGGPHDEATLYLLLTDTVTAGGNAGVAMIRSGSANATVLSSMKLTTYLGGAEQESVTGSGLTTYVINSSTGLRAIEFTSTKRFDAVAITLEKLGGGVNWADIYFAYGNNPAPLPVESVQFTAEYNSGRVNINWQTASEYNNSHFVVQKSFNGVDFIDMETIRGYGNSNNIKRYSAKDYMPGDGYNYYRLIQVDFNGDKTFSKIIAVNTMEDKNMIPPKVYPNPAVNNIHIAFNDNIANADIKLGDVMGNILINQPVTNNNIELNISEVKPGTYILYIFGADGTLIHKQIITKTI